MKENLPSKKSFRKEIYRKLIHLLELPVILGYTLFRLYFGEKAGFLALTVTLIVMLEIEYIRLEHKVKMPVELDVLLRQHEKDNLVGSIFFVMATIICLAAYDYQIAVLALLMTVFGDLVSALVGIKFGRIEIYKQKTLEGMVSGFLANLLVGLMILPGEVGIVMAMSLVASFVEVFTGKLDDNLTVPLAAGFVGQVIVYWFGLNLNVFPGGFIRQISSFVGF